MATEPAFKASAPLVCPVVVERPLDRVQTNGYLSQPESEPESEPVLALLPYGSREILEILIYESGRTSD